MPEVTPTAAPGEAPWRHPDRIVPKTAEAAIKLKERMLSARAGSPTRTRRSTGPSPPPTAGPRTLRLRMRSHACSPSTSNGPARERNVLDKVATVECVEIECQSGGNGIKVVQQAYLPAVDGHGDKKPLRTTFPYRWSMSAARFFGRPMYFSTPGTNVR